MNVIIFTDVNNTYGLGRDPGAYRIATELREYGYSVQVIDFFASLTLDDIQKIADKFVTNETYVVGFSTTHYADIMQTVYAQFNLESFVERCKVFSNCDCFPQHDKWIEDMQSIFLDANPNIKFVVGGEKAVTATKERYNIDHWIYGNAEVSMLELLKNLSSFPKIVHSNRDYNFKGFDKCKITWTHNDLIFPGEHLPIEVGRGCSFNCPFCSYRKKSPTDLIKDVNTLRDELLYNYETFGTTGYMVMDPTFNDSLSKVQAYCDLFKSMPFQMEWSGFARVDVFAKYPEMADMMLESGAKSIQFGVETLHTPTMKVIHKGVSAELTKKTLHQIKNVWKDDVITGSFFIIGLPEETEDDFRSNMEWAFDPDCPIHSIDLGILTIRKYIDDIKEEVQFSKFSRDHNRYDYSGPKQWLNKQTGMTRQRAFEILYDLSTRNIDRKTIDFYYYSRMRNLGYTFDELWSMRKDYADTFIDSNALKDKLIKKYIGMLLSI